MRFFQACVLVLFVLIPQTVHAGLRVARLGATSVSYEVGLFALEKKLRSPLVGAFWKVQAGGP